MHTCVVEKDASRRKFFEERSVQYLDRAEQLEKLLDGKYDTVDAAVHAVPDAVRERGACSASHRLVTTRHCRARRGTRDRRRGWRYHGKAPW